MRFLMLFFGVLVFISSPLFAESPASQAEPEGEPPVQVVGTQRMLELIRDNRGKVLVTNYWATWCAPCQEEMPELVKFYREYSPKGVVFLSFSADHPDDLDSAVGPYLKKEKLPFPVYLIGGVSPNEFVNAVDPEWVGSLPATFVYNPEGERVQSWFEKIQKEDIERQVKVLLEDSKEAGS
jgi:thiol-disulfide isomerase/thioredoxin